MKSEKQNADRPASSEWINGLGLGIAGSVGNQFGNTTTSNLNVTFSFTTLTISAAATPPPNILWLTWEDIGPHLRCFGDD